MLRQREILSLLSQGQSQKSICSIVHCSKRSVSEVSKAARDTGKTLLVLDTASADAERLYERMGWTRVGTVPGFALHPHGGLTGTTFYYREIT